MKTLLLIFLFPVYVSAQGYATAGYAYGVKKHYHSSGIYFGAGWDIKNFSAGFNAEFLDLNYPEQFAIAAADLRYNYSKFFVSFQPGKVLYDKTIEGLKTKGTYSYSLLAGVNYKILSGGVGYQNVGFKVEGIKTRGGFIKAFIGFRII